MEPIPCSDDSIDALVKTDEGVALQWRCLNYAVTKKGEKDGLIRHPKP
jgi:hypothetical protein